MSSTAHWLMKLDGHPPVTTDDLTLDELDVAERACGVPYTRMDPHGSVRVAKALLAVMLMRAKRAEGLTAAEAEDEALAVAGGLRVQALHDAFTFVPPDSPGSLLRRVYGEGQQVPPSSAPTSVAG